MVMHGVIKASPDLVDHGLNPRPVWIALRRQQRLGCGAPLLNQ